MNQEIADIFYEIADILEMQKVKWKPAAYRNAARALESLGEDVREIYKREGKTGLQEIYGVGEALSKKIEEYIHTGKIKKLLELRKTIPRGVVELMKVQGIGVKKALKLHEELGVKSVKELEKAAKKKKIQKIETFKQKTEENILEGIEFMKKNKGRILLGFALPIARNIVEELKSLKGVKEAVAAGSLRRMEETIGDIDILVISGNNKEVADFFIKMPDVKRVLAKGDTKAAVVLKDNLQVDLRLIKPESFGSALQYFTGNKSHNIHLRNIALKRGFKLSEYGLFRGWKQIAGKTEEEVYRKLGMQYIEPELRTERGEIEVALKKILPKLISYEDIEGDLHMHTKYSDAGNTIEEMAMAAKDLGLKYIAITDHCSERGMKRVNGNQLEKQVKEIDKVNRKVNGIEVLKGAEVDIKADGTLSLDDSFLKKLDVVIASVHSGFKFPEEKQTARVLKAMDNPYVRILGHPTGRLISRRVSLNLNLEKIYKKAKEKGIALEVNSSIDRLDLSDAHIREAVEQEVKLAIGTDSHNVLQLRQMELGVGTARRGWCTKKDVINTLSLSKLKKFLKK